MRAVKSTSDVDSEIGSDADSNNGSGSESDLPSKKDIEKELQAKPRFVEVLNIINPDNVIIDQELKTFESYKYFSFLNCKNLNTNFDKDSKKYFELKFINSSFVLFDLTSWQRLRFKCSRGSFYFGEGFESMTLIKSNRIRFKEIGCLYLPLEAILEIKWQEFSSIPS